MVGSWALGASLLAHTNVRHALWRQTGDVGEHAGESLHVAGKVSAGGGPGGAHLDLECAWRAANFAVADRGRGGHGAAQVGVRAGGGVQLLGQPIPCDFWEERVGCHGCVHVSLNVSDHAHLCAVPALVAVGVVEEDESSKGIATVVRSELGNVAVLVDLWVEYLQADGVAQRRKVAGRADVAHADSGTYFGVRHGLHGLVEVLGNVSVLLCLLAHNA